MSLAHSPALERFRDDGPLAIRIRRRSAAVPGTLLLGLAVVAAPTSLHADDVVVRVSILGGALVLALLGTTGSPSARLGWLEPALVRALEYVTVIVLLGDRVAGFVLLAALAYRHYDQVYTHRHAPGRPPPAASQAAGGWELRTGALIAAAMAGVATTVALGISALVVLASVVASMAAWRSTDH
jgi:hypothetical protein